MKTIKFIRKRDLDNVDYPDFRSCPPISTQPVDIFPPIPTVGDVVNINDEVLIVKTRVFNVADTEDDDIVVLYIVVKD